MSEIVEPLTLAWRRRLLGYVVPFVDIPILGLDVYQAYTQLLGGASWKSSEFTKEMIIIIVIVGITVILPQQVAIYQSSYTLEERGLVLRRFLRSTLVIPYKKVERVELYIRDEGEIDKDAEKYAKDSTNKFQKVGFKFVDYTNDERNIALLFSGRQVLMISPAKPIGFLKSLKQHVPKLKGRIVELHVDGKNVKELD